MRSMASKITLPLLIFIISFSILAIGIHPSLLFHPDETFYLQSPREMQKTGDYITPFFDGHPRFQKPVLFYWVIAGAYNLLGDHMVSARMASTFFAALTMLVLFLFLSQWKNKKIASLSILGIVSSYGFFSQSHIAVTDMALNFFITLALFLYWWNEKKDSLYLRWGFFLSLGLAFLTKGPVGFVIPILTILLFTILTRRASALRIFSSWSGWWIALVVGIPWFIIMWRIHGAAFISYFLHDESRVRLAPNQKSIFYLLFSYLLFLFPWTLLIPIFKWKRIKLSPWYLFLFAWVFTPLLIFSFIPNKHSYYVLPSVIPAVILLFSLLFDTSPSLIEKKFPKHFGTALLLITIPIAAAILFTYPLFDHPWDLAFYPGLLLSI